MVLKRRPIPSTCWTRAGAISVTARQQYILRVRTLARSVAQAYLLARAKLGFLMATPDLRDEVLAKLEAAQ